MTKLHFTLNGVRYSLSATDALTSTQGHHPEPVTKYFVEISGRWWPVKQVLSLAISLPKQEFTSGVAQRTLRRLGFDVRKHEPASENLPLSPITTTRVTAPTSGSGSKLSTRRGTQTITLVGCVKSKREFPSQAANLYNSPYFRKMRAHAELRAGPWFILSAEHGLVRPEQRLAPYDRYLADCSTGHRRDWGQRVVKQIEGRFENLPGMQIEVHAGAVYVDAIRSLLEARGAIVVEPLRNLRLGQRLAWYDRTTAAFHEQVTALVALFDDDAVALPAQELLTKFDSELDRPGLYGWWVDSEGAAQLSQSLDHRLDPGLIYAGQAGANSTNGVLSAATLRSRIQGNHLGSSASRSTLRLSLGSLLATRTKSHIIDEDALTTWMLKHLRIVGAPVEDRQLLGALEQRVLARLDPPLNLQHMPRTPIREALSSARARYPR